MASNHPAATVDAALLPPARPTDRVTFAGFTSLALLLSAWARANDLQVPQYRSPPRMLGVTRTLRRTPGSRPVVSVRLVGRDRSRVVRDMVDGLLAVNPQPGPGSVGASGVSVSKLRDAAFAYLLAEGSLGAVDLGGGEESTGSARCDGRVGPGHPVAA